MRAMPRFRIHLSAAPEGPVPALDSLPEVEAESAIAALAKYINQSPVPKWSVAIVFKVPDEPSIPIAWMPDLDWTPPH